MAVGITVEKRYMQNFAEQLDAALANQAILGAHSEEVRVDHYFAKKEELTGEFARFLQKEYFNDLYAKPRRKMHLVLILNGATKKILN